MTTTARTDVHSPTNLVTEDYRYVTAFDSNEGMDVASANRDIASEGLGDKEWHVHPDTSGWQRCSHCGQRIRYCAVMHHAPSDQLLVIGEQCLSNRFDLATRDFHRLRKAAELVRQSQRIVAERERFFTENPSGREAYEYAIDQLQGRHNDFLANYVSKIERYGSTSQRFVDAVLRDKAKRAERQAEQEQEVREPISDELLEGRQQITGQVVSVKTQENDYGVREVMTVRDDRGFLVWGTVPSAIDDVVKGQRVSFVAGLQRSDKDECFGFFKRPTGAEIL